MKNRFSLVLVALLVVLVAVPAAAGPGNGPQAVQEVTHDQFIDARFAWVSTGLTLKAGAPVTVTASGTAHCLVTNSQCIPRATGPDGSTYVASVGRWLVLGLPRQSLVARVGTDAPVFVGSGPTEISGDGVLYFAVNSDVTRSIWRGGYLVSVTYTCMPGHGYGNTNHYHCGPPGRR